MYLSWCYWGGSKNKYELNIIGGKKVSAINNQKPAPLPQNLPLVPS
jgi:hypothetical protein